MEEKNNFLMKWKGKILFKKKGKNLMLSKDEGKKVIEII